MATSVQNSEGRPTFEFILRQVRDCIKDLKPFFDLVEPERLYNKSYYAECSKITESRPGVDLNQLAMCDISFAIVFFGLSQHDLTTFMRLYIDNYNNTFLRYIIFYLGLKPHPDHKVCANHWSNFNRDFHSEMMTAFGNDMAESQKSGLYLDRFLTERKYAYDELKKARPYKFYGGHQFKLGHYYRHLFQTVKYINEQTIFDYCEKYEFAKTLRAQLSTPEQYLLFFNSLSITGREWEYSKIQSSPNENVNCHLITKYNLIKNIPDLYFEDEILINSFYPDVHFEFRLEPDNRKALELLFK